MSPRRERSSLIGRLKRGVDRVLAWLLIAPMAASVLLVLWQVFTRYVLADPSAWTDEAVRYLLVWIGLLGAAYAAGQRMHLAIDLLPSRLEGAAHHRLAALIQLLIAAFAAAVMVVGGGHLVRLTLALGQTSATLGVPLGYVYLVLPLAGVLVLFYSLTFAAEHVRLAAEHREGG